MSDDQTDEQTDGRSTAMETATDAPEVEPAAAVDEVVVEDLLVEEVSIDGMCGVY